MSPSVSGSYRWTKPGGATSPPFHGRRETCPRSSVEAPRPCGCSSAAIFSYRSSAPAPSPWPAKTPAGWRRCNAPTRTSTNCWRTSTGDDVEQFLVDSILTRTMECPVEVLQQFVDVLVGALHRRQPAGVFAGQGLGAGAEERYEKIAADEHPQGRGAAADDLGQVSRRPWNGGEVAPPGFVQR